MLEKQFPLCKRMLLFKDWSKSQILGKGIGDTLSKPYLQTKGRKLELLIREKRYLEMVYPCKLAKFRGLDPNPIDPNLFSKSFLF